LLPVDLWQKDKNLNAKGAPALFSISEFLAPPPSLLQNERRFFSPPSNVRFGAPESAKLKGILTRGALYAHPTELGEFLQGSVSAEPTPPTILYTAKRHLWLIVNRLIVYVNDA
jgi:hypothetical protein